MGRKHRIFPKDLVQFPQSSHWYPANSVLLPCPPHRISPLWEKDHLSQTEQMSHLDPQTRITAKTPPHSYYYQNELGSSPWLKHLATATELSQSFARTKAVPLPHLYHQDMTKVSPSHRYQKVASVLPLHNRYDIKDKIALKSFHQDMIPSGSDHLPKIFLSSDHSTENLLPLNQQLPSPPFFDNKAELSSFLGHRSMTEGRIYPDFHGKDKPSVISMSPGNQARVARRLQSQVRATTATTLGSFNLRHTATLTSSSLCFSHWSRAAALKTPVLDHWVQAKASKMSYPDLHLRETVSLLRCIDHHSRPLAAYSLCLNQKTRAATVNSSCPKLCVKSTTLPSSSSNFQARTRSALSQGVKPWDKGSASHWVTATSVPSSLHHQMAGVPAKQALPQSTSDHQTTCSPSSKYYQVKYVTDPSTQDLLQKEKGHYEVIPQDRDYQFTMLTGQVYWATPPVGVEYNDTSPSNYDKRATAPFSHGYQAENEPESKAQGTLTPELDDWETMSLGPDYEVTHFKGQDQWATPSQHVIAPQKTILSGPEKQTTPLPSKDHQAEAIAVDSSAQVIFQQELDEWETNWRKDQKSSSPPSIDHQAQDPPEDPRDQNAFQQESEKWEILCTKQLDRKLTPPSSDDHQTEAKPEDPSAQVIFHQELDEWETIWKRRLNHQSTPPPNNDHQAQGTPEDPSVHITLKEEPHEWDRFWPTRLDNQDTPPPGNDHQAQDISADHSAQIVFSQEVNKKEIFWTQRLNHQSTPPPNNNHQAHDTPEDSGAHTTPKQEPDNLGTFCTKGPDNQATPSPGNNQEAQDIPASNSEASSKQKTVEWETFWPRELQKQGTILTNQVFSATSRLDLKYQDRTSPDLHHRATLPPSHGDQASDVLELSVQATQQPELGKRETFWPRELDKQATTLKDKVCWATSSWDIKDQGRTSPDLHQGVPPPLSREENQASDVLDLSTQAITQQEIEEWDTFWPTEVDQQATTLKDKFYWATPTLGLKDQYRTSPDPLHRMTPPPSHENQTSNLTDLSAQAILQQELGKRGTSCPTEVYQQTTTLTDKVYQVTSPSDTKHQDRISPDLRHGTTPPPSHDDKASDVLDLSTQATLQQELGKRETSWPRELDKQALALTDKVYWAISLYDIKHQDITSPDLQQEATPPSSHDDQDSDVTDFIAQVTLQQELGERETSWPTEVDHQATTLKDKIYWATPTLDLKHQQRTLPPPHRGTTTPPSHEDNDSDVTHLSAQAKLQELDEWETSCPTELDKQATTLNENVYRGTSLRDIKHQKRISPELHYKATPLPSHKDQDSDVSDLSVHATLQQELNEWETFYPTELDKQVTTLKDKVYWAASTLNLKHQERTSLALHHGVTPLPRHGDQASDVIDLNAQATLHQKLGKRETSCATELDKQATTLEDKISWAASPWDIKHPDRNSPDPHHEATPLPSHDDQASNLSDLSAQETLQLDIDEWGKCWPIELDQQGTTIPAQVSWAISPWDIKHHDKTLPDTDHTASPSSSHKNQDVDVPEPSAQVTLQPKLDQWEIMPSVLDEKVTNPTSQHSQAVPSMGIIEPQNIAPCDPEHQTTLPSNSDHQVGDIPEPNSKVTLQQRQDNWDIFLTREDYQTHLHSTMTTRPRIFQALKST
ncbi:uncharacterized protein LOC110208181 [Phascolarctos cinereus]|uniref:Uncharacterized protein LOC110208181 n=1 Tax=Phascolarctos cinereus TaxID=38626 RepID=A0A6P5K8A8_PHACI|nr:uncharacterized protein LOC110208181 [Phascolarctos cinereus]